jgi:hypothetical protein
MDIYNKLLILLFLNYCYKCSINFFNFFFPFFLDKNTDSQPKTGVRCVMHLETTIVTYSFVSFPNAFTFQILGHGAAHCYAEDPILSENTSSLDKHEA